MTGIKFYKATSRGGLDPIENSADSLHYRRSIVIDDPDHSTIWIIHGSGAAKTTQKSAEKNANKIGDASGKDYQIEFIEYDNAEEKINDILSGSVISEPTDNTNLLPIPEVPGKSKRRKETPKENTEEEGPIIREFQISYYTEDVEYSEELREIVSTYETEVQSILKEKPSKSSAKKSLQKLTNDIIDIIYG